MPSTTKTSTSPMAVCVPSKKFRVVGDCHKDIVTLPPRLGPAAVGEAAGAGGAGAAAGAAQETLTDTASARNENRRAFIFILLSKCKSPLRRVGLCIK